MNENTAALIEKLANKLGTTSEYLWSILLRQAPISATVDIIVMCFTAIFGVILYKLHMRFIKKEVYQDLDIAAGLPMIIGVVTFAIFTIIDICSISNIFNGYFNREYWALKEVLNSINH